jgi:hypothetical protein
MNKYISYESQDITITIGFILLILSQLAHVMFKDDKYIYKIIFILSYITLIIGIILERNKIHIINFISKIIVIVLVTIGMYIDINN